MEVTSVGQRKYITLATVNVYSCPSEIKTVRLTDWFELKTVQYT